MIARIFIFLLFPAVPLVAGLQNIRPNLRQLQIGEADLIAAKHNMGVAIVMEESGSDASVENILKILYEAMEGDEEIPPFDEDEMSALADYVFSADENGNVDVIQRLTNVSEGLSSTSPVMAVVYEIMSDLESVQSVEECTDKIAEAAEESGEESEMMLASISDAVAEASGQYWNTVDVVRRKLQLVTGVIPLVPVTLADVFGALIGFLAGGFIGAIVLGVLASVLAAMQLSFPIC